MIQKETRLYRVDTLEEAKETKKRLMSVSSAIKGEVKKEGRGYSVYITYRRIQPKRQLPRGNPVPTPKAEKIKAKGEVEVEKPEIGLPFSPSTEEYHHIRIRNPGYFDKKSFRIITFGEGIKATIGCPRGKFKAGKCTVGTKIQKLLFPKLKYTEKEALEWVKEHPKIRLRKKKK